MGKVRTVSTEHLFSLAVSFSSHADADVLASEWPHITLNDPARSVEDLGNQASPSPTLKEHLVRVDEDVTCDIERICLAFAALPEARLPQFRRLISVCFDAGKFSLIKEILHGLALLRKYVMLHTLTKEAAVKILRLVVTKEGDHTAALKCLEDMLIGWPSADMLQAVARALEPLEHHPPELLSVLRMFAQAHRAYLDVLDKPHTALSVEMDVSEQMRDRSWFRHHGNDERGYTYPIFPWFEGLWKIPTVQHQTEPAELHIHAVGRGAGRKLSGFIGAAAVQGAVIDVAGHTRVYARGAECGVLELAISDERCCGVLSHGTRRQVTSGFMVSCVKRVAFKASLDPNPRFSEMQNLRFLPGRGLRMSLKDLAKQYWAMECWLLAEPGQGSARAIHVRGLVLSVERNGHEAVLKAVHLGDTLAEVPFAVGVSIHVRVALQKDLVTLDVNHQTMARPALKKSLLGKDILELGGAGFKGFIGDLKISEAAPDRSDKWAVKASFLVSSASIFGAGLLDLIGASILEPMNELWALPHAPMARPVVQGFRRVWLGESVQAFTHGDVQLQPHLELSSNGELWLENRVKLLERFKLRTTVQVPAGVCRLKLSTFAGSFWEIFKRAACLDADKESPLTGLLSIEFAKPGAEIRIRCGRAEIVEVTHLNIPMEGTVDILVKYDGIHLSISVNEARVVHVKANLREELAQPEELGFMVGVSCSEGTLRLENLEVEGGDGVLASRGQTPALEPVIEEVVVMEKWSCPSCTFLNPADATICSMCSTSAPGSSNAAKRRPQEEPKSVDQTWDCPKCTFKNEASSTVCTMCESPRPNVLPDLTPMDVTDVTERSLDATMKRRADVLSAAISVIPARAETTEDSINASGHWDTTSGILEITDVEAAQLPMWPLQGTFQGVSPVQGYACIVPAENAEDATWELAATWRSSKWLEKGDDTLRKAGVYEVDCKLEESGETLRGSWTHAGGGKGQIQASLEKDGDAFRGLSGPDAPFYTGLVNMKDGLTNVCYQNALIQSLFMTDGFRKDLLKAVPGSLSSCGRSLQEVMTTLLLSQRPALKSTKLQKSLPGCWKSGRQHDVSDFHDFLFGELPSTLVDGEFGSVTAEVRRCTICEQEKVTKEESRGLAISMPEQYLPITALSLVCCDADKFQELSVAHNYERIPVNLNQGRRQQPCVFLCISRQAGDVPITNIIVSQNQLNLEDYHITPCNTDLVSRPLSPQSKKIFIYYRSSKTGSPITEIRFIQGPPAVPNGFKVIDTNLNPLYMVAEDLTKDPTDVAAVPVATPASSTATPQPIRLCYRLGMPITDVVLGATAPRGDYQMVDVSLNVAVVGGSVAERDMYMWTSCASGRAPITRLFLVEEDEVEQALENRFVDSCGEAVFIVGKKRLKMMKERGNGCPLTQVDVFRCPRVMPKYRFNDTLTLFSEPPESEDPFSIRSHIWKVAADEAENTDKSWLPIGRSLEFTTVPLDEQQMVAVVQGTFSKGIINGCVFKDQDVLQFVGKCRTHAATAGWEAVRFTVNEAGVLNGHIMQESRSTVVSAKKLAEDTRLKLPIVDITLVRGHEPVPDGWEKVHGFNSYMTDNDNVNRDCKDSEPCSLLFRRANSTIESDRYITKITVFIPEMEQIEESPTCEVMEVTYDGKSADLNYEKEGLRTFLCIHRDPSMSTAVHDLALVWKDLGETTADGYDTIKYSATGIADAKLSPKHSVFLCVKQAMPYRVIIPHPMNGAYDHLQGDWEDLQLYAVAAPAHNVYRCEATFTNAAQSLMQTEAHMNGIIFKMDHDVVDKVLNTGKLKPSDLRGTVVVFAGMWRPDETSASSGASSSSSSFAVWTFEASLRSAKVQRYLGKSQGAMTFLKDDEIVVGMLSDPTELWAQGHQVFSDRYANNSVENLVEHYFNQTVMDGANKPTCDSEICQGAKQVHVQSVRLFKEPVNLVLTIKRMSFDNVLNKIIKNIAATPFSPVIVVRTKSSRLRYALYAVVVHKGENANSGHYFSYARHSSCTDLDKCNSTISPWIRFNDQDVGVVSWDAMVKEITNSSSTTPYLLFYTKLGVEDEDEDKAMAHAIQLSVSLSSEESTNVAHRLQAAAGSPAYCNEFCAPVVEENKRLVMENLPSRTSPFYAEMMLAASTLPTV